MADITELKTLLDLYGVGVRAGAITPQSEDEAYYRDIIGLPVMSTEVKAYWKKTKNIRRPLTLQPPLDGSTPAPAPASSGEDDDE